MDHISGIDRHQIQMLALDDFVANDSMSRIIDAFVDTLDFEKFQFSYFKLNKEGHPPFHASVMVKIYLYGYQHSIRSCRKLEHACKVNVELMWLTSGLSPHYKTIACKGYKLRAECTKNKNGRYIERTEYAEYIERNNTRVNQNPNYYRQRQQIIEHQFGTLKRHRHFDYTLMTRKENVMSEVYIQFILYNLRRTASILDPKALIKRLKAMKNGFSGIFRTRFTVKAHRMRLNSKILFDMFFSSVTLNPKFNVV